MEKLIFSKYSNERARRFAIRTDIVSDDSKKLTVFKRNLYPEGQQHIKNIYTWYNRLSESYQGTQIELNHCDYREDKVALEYLNQLTLENELNELLKKQKLEQFNTLLFSYIDEVKKGGMIQPFVKTERFVETFGDVEIEDALSAEVTNIDMVLNNVILGEKWTIIDYEWTFDFPIPANFVIYRILHYFVANSHFPNRLNAVALFDQAGITEAELEIYASMERHFQMKFLLSDEQQENKLVPIREMHEDISPGGIDLKRIYDEEKMHRDALVQVFESDAHHFSEENSFVVHCNIDKQITLKIDLKPETDFLRFDPHENPCNLSGLTITDEEGSPVPVLATNGIFIKKDRIVFLEDDPQLVVGNLKEKTQLTFSYQIKLTDMEEREILQAVFSEKAELTEELEQVSEEKNLVKAENDQYRETVAEKEQQLAYQSEVISNMENTKIWKAYEQYKKTFRKT